ncbi:MAG: histidine kinase dimerization/phospho-acceptor domain-containing protein, partial [Gemmatimonadales bacterium]
MSRPPASTDTRWATSLPDALAELGRRLANVEDARAATDLLADTVRHTLEPDGLLIVLTDPASRSSHVAHTYQYPDARPEDPLIRHVITRGPRVTPGTASPLELPPRLSVGSWVACPVPGKDGPRGAISAVTERADRYDREHLAFLAGAAALFALTLDHLHRLRVLSRGKREWEELVDAVGEAFCVVDDGGCIVRANRPFCDMMHVDVSEIAGTPWRDLMPESWHAPIRRALEAPGRASGGDVTRASRRYTVLALDLPTPGGAALSFVDHTERHRLEEQLVQSAKLTAIGQLIAGVAHDLNNPLASVVGFADFLVEESDPPPAMREPLLAIRQEAERAAAIVRNLLQFARRQEEERRVQPIGDVLEATVALLHNQFVGWKIPVTLTIDDDLPDVVINRNQIQQVFVNVLTNAGQAIHTSGTGSRVVVTVSR